MRAVLEAMVNHLIHRDYTVMGGEVHLDIYDDRLVIISPGGMYNGKLIQELNLEDVSSERRNPILANVMAQLNYMEKRGSGLTKICKETKALNQENENEKVIFKSTSTQFQTIIYSTASTQNIGNNVGDFVGDKNKINLSERQRVILEMIRKSPTITGRQMSETLSVTQRTIERDLFYLKKKGVIKHKGKDNAGFWVVLL